MADDVEGAPDDAVLEALERAHALARVRSVRVVRQQRDVEPEPSAVGDGAAADCDLELLRAKAAALRGALARERALRAEAEAAEYGAPWCGVACGCLGARERKRRRYLLVEAFDPRDNAAAVFARSDATNYWFAPLDGLRALALLWTQAYRAYASAGFVAAAYDDDGGAGVDDVAGGATPEGFALSLIHI